MGSVTVTAKRLLSDAVADSGRRSTVQLPEEFARITTADQTSTPLSRLFKRGEPTLKLYLTLVLMTRKPPHDLFRQYNNQYWANLFGFEERSGAKPAPGAGTRRIKRAMDSLETDVEPDGARVERRVERGRGPVLRVVHPDEPLRAPYITLPIELWSRGWINVMSARALFVYISLRLLFVSKPEAEGLPVSVWERERFAMGDDSWHRGVAELERLRLVRSDFDTVKADDWSTDRRKRKIYCLNQTYLRENDSPTMPV